LAFRSHFYKIRNNIISHPFLLPFTSLDVTSARPSVLKGKSRASLEFETTRTIVYKNKPISFQLK
jgi:hypothetical protein